MHPATFLRVLGPEPWRCAYVQPSRRPADGRYGENPFRLGKHLQLQVVLKPSPDDVQDALSAEPASGSASTRRARHPLRGGQLGVADARRLGGGLAGRDGRDGDHAVHVLPAGRGDRPRADLGRDHVRARADRDVPRQGRLDLRRPVERSRDVRAGAPEEEFELSKYYFEVADVALAARLLDRYEAEARRCLDAGLVLPAYEATLECSHLFNVLDARGAVSATDRVGIDPPRPGPRLRLRPRLVSSENAAAPSRARASIGPEARGGASESAIALFAPGHQRSRAHETHDFLLEIRTEEIPARVVAGARGISRAASRRHWRGGISRPDGVESYATPRRLIWSCEGSPSARPTAMTEVLGPAGAAAFDAEGQATRAAEGLRPGAEGRRCADLVVVDSPRGRTVAVRRTMPGRAAAEVLADVVPRVVAAMTFPKTMRWGERRALLRPARARRARGLRRPGRAVRALRRRGGKLDGRPPVLSEVGIPCLGSGRLPAEAAAALRRAGRRSAADPHPRRRARARGSGRRLDRVGLGPGRRRSRTSSSGPALVRGAFEPEFLELPEEITTTAMRTHQKYLPVRGPAGLLPSFIAVMDNAEDQRGLDREGQRVGVERPPRGRALLLRGGPRQSLESRLPELERLTFQDRLGDYAARPRASKSLPRRSPRAVGRARIWRTASGRPHGSPRRT